MKIVAKFASVCPCCGGRLAAGEVVEWARGSRARHVACPPPVKLAGHGSPWSVSLGLPPPGSPRGPFGEDDDGSMLELAIKKLGSYEAVCRMYKEAV